MNNRSFLFTLPPCVVSAALEFAVAVELEAERLHAILEELPVEYWPPWVPADPAWSGWLRLRFYPRAPGLMSTVPPPPTGGIEVAREWKARGGL